MNKVKPLIVIKEIISKVLKCDKRRIFVKTDIVNDLGADSMKILEIIIAIERELNIEIDDERIGDVFDELMVRDFVDAANHPAMIRNRRDYFKLKPIASSNVLVLNRDNF